MANPKMRAPVNQARLIQPRKPSIKFVEHGADLHALHPRDFLLAVVRCRYIEIQGQKYEPTSAERKQAAQHLAAVLAGADTQPERDDFYLEKEKP